MGPPPVTKRAHKKLLRLFPVPTFLTIPAVGFDVSDHAVRFIEFVSTKKGPKIGRFGARPVPVAAIKGGVIEKKDAVLEVLAAMKEEYKLDFVHASLPSEQAYLFNSTVPGVHLSDKDIRNILAFKLEESVPIPPQEAIFAFDRIEEVKAAQSTRLNVTVLPYKMVSEYLELFTAAKLFPVSMEVEAQATAKAVVPAGDDRPVMVVDFGAIKSGLSIVHRGVVQFTSVLDIGSQKLTNALQNGLSLSPEEAEHVKREKGLVLTQENRKVFDILSREVSVLCDEIKRHITYWNEHSPRDISVQGQIDPIAYVVLCGGGANLTGLPGHLFTALDVDVFIADVWANVFSIEEYLPDVSFQESLSYVTAIGLAMRSTF